MKRSFYSRPVFIAVLSIVLVGIIGAGSTLAYYIGYGGYRLNAFSFSENIRAILSEPNWDAAEGQKLVPGKTVRKDPVITNTCAIEEYVALKLTFQKSDQETALTPDEMQKLLRCIAINWNVDTGANQWTLVSGKDSTEQIFYYNQALSPGEVSDPLFHDVTVKTNEQGLSEELLRWLQGVKFADGELVEDETGLGGFNIRIEGAAVQADGYSSPAAAVDAFKTLFS